MDVPGLAPSGLKLLVKRILKRVYAKLRERAEGRSKPPTTWNIQKESFPVEGGYEPADRRKFSDIPSSRYVETFSMDSKGVE